MECRRTMLPCVTLIALLSCRAPEAASSGPQNPYLGQEPPGSEAVVFAPGIVSTGHHEHSRLEFSDDGAAMFWAVIPVDEDRRAAGGSPFMITEQNIWTARRVDGGWTDPEVLSLTRTSGGSSPVVRASGRTFYFRTPKPGADPGLRPRPSQLWRAARDDGGWAEPVRADGLLPDEEGMACMSFCFAENGNLYFDHGGPGETGEWAWDIYFAEFRDGRHLPPVRMAHGINDGVTSWCPWIAPDESYLIYSSHREGEFGHGDLYVNYRDEDGGWSAPVHLGEGVNTARQERFPSVSPDGRYLFFTRHMPRTYGDVFWVEATVIEEARP